MINTWVEEVVEFGKSMTEEEFKKILSRADLSCEKCGTCCIIPKLGYVDKPANVRCRHLTKENLCELHMAFGAIKPEPCQKFPYMDNKEWVLDWRLAPPRRAIFFCGIVRKFWLEAYLYMTEKKNGL